MKIFIHKLLLFFFTTSYIVCSLDNNTSPTELKKYISLIHTTTPHHKQLPSLKDISTISQQNNSAIPKEKIIDAIQDALLLIKKYDYIYAQHCDIKTITECLNNHLEQGNITKNLPFTDKHQGICNRHNAKHLEGCHDHCEKHDHKRNTNKQYHLSPNMIADKQPYIKGGLVFTYPIDLFSVNPIINISVSAPPHASNITYTAEVSAENTITATVMVYKNSSGVITEASTGEVNVYFTAIGT